MVLKKLAKKGGYVPLNECSLKWSCMKITYVVSEPSM